jgi:DNA-binding Xre family transcriptional regulator
MPVKILDYIATSTLASSTTIEFKDNRRLRQKPTAQFIPPMKSFYSEEEAFDILFTDEKSKRIYQEESRKLDEELLAGIRAGKINPIRGWRILRGMEQKTLSLLTGIRQPNLSRMEKLGAPTPRVQTLRKVARILRISVEDLIYDR